MPADPYTTYEKDRTEDMVNPTIAVFHNYLDNIGGAEIVGLTLARELHADVYTTNIDADMIRKMGFSDVLPRVYSIGKVPIHAPWKQQCALFRFRQLNLGKKYAFYIIGGDWAMSGVVHNKPNLWYVHSPIREIWDSYEYVRNTVIHAWQRPLFDIWVTYNRWLNKKYLSHVDALVCNSKNTQKRIQKFLQKDAVIIHPPIDTSSFHYAENGGFWLSVNRLFAHKRIELQLEAFRDMPHERLILVGSYEQSKHFKEYAARCIGMKPDNVEIRSWVSKEELVNLYAHCKGFITTSMDEDFGMNAVEAMASGKPVVAPQEGGYQETVIDGETGVLIHDINKDKLVEALKRVGKNPAYYKDACIVHAQKYSVASYIKKIKDILRAYTK